jgi:hypothetical protein|tara:strand:+ start:153 stop:398 length:246 start_codon:yes stop_codon:yes gene_type:complete
MDTIEFKRRLENSSLLGTSQGCVSSIKSRLDLAFDCINKMEDDCEWGKAGYDIEKKYLKIHLKNVLETANELTENLEKIEL